MFRMRPCEQPNNTTRFFQSVHPCIRAFFAFGCGDEATRTASREQPPHKTNSILPAAFHVRPAPCKSLRELPLTDAAMLAVHECVGLQSCCRKPVRVEQVPLLRPCFRSCRCPVSHGTRQLSKPCLEARHTTLLQPRAARMKQLA